MPVSRRERLVYGQTGWMAAVTVALAALDALSLGAFVVLSFVGLLVAVELTAPVGVTPAWRVRLRWVVLGGAVVVVAVVARNVLAAAPAGVLP